MTLVWSILALVMGISVAMQGAINASASKDIGTGTILVVNSIIVTIGALILFFTLPGQKHSITAFSQLKWYEFTGGVFGFTIIFLAIILFPRLGAGLTLVLAVSAQLTAGMLMEHFGFLGLPQHPITLTKIVGVILIVAGAALVKLF